MVIDKAAIALDILPMLEAKAKERMRKHGVPEPEQVFEPTTLRAASQTAELVCASATQVYNMKKITREALERVEAIKYLFIGLTA